MTLAAERISLGHFGIGEFGKPLSVDKSRAVLHIRSVTILLDTPSGTNTLADWFVYQMQVQTYLPKRRLH